MMYSACFAGVRILWRECSGCDAVAHDCCVRLGHDLCMLCMLYCGILACIARCADDSIDQCVHCVCGKALLLYQKQARTVVSNVYYGKQYYVMHILEPHIVVITQYTNGFIAYS
eukprot:14980-Heterococcus_DN1.PRE.1